MAVTTRPQCLHFGQANGLRDLCRPALFAVIGEAAVLSTRWTARDAVVLGDADGGHVVGGGLAVHGLDSLICKGFLPENP